MGVVFSISPLIKEEGSSGEEGSNLDLLTAVNALAFELHPHIIKYSFLSDNLGYANNIKDMNGIKLTKFYSTGSKLILFLFLMFWMKN